MVGVEFSLKTRSFLTALLQCVLLVLNSSNIAHSRFMPFHRCFVVIPQLYQLLWRTGIRWFDWFQEGGHGVHCFF
jgi:hypothetical protein